uniref:Cytochrome P450 n=1 Tax=Plectus sambesii TaxID=2011161 RepID=A0A914WU73_9BILA
MLAWVLLGILTAAFWFYHLNWKRRNLPPGPTPLPFIGNILDIARNPPGYKCYTDWSKEYGGVFTYWLGPMPVVAVTDYDMIQETFVKDGETYAGRKVFDYFMDRVRGGHYGIIETEGPLWREQRRFSLHVLRDFGFGRNLMEERVLDEVRAMTAKLTEDVGATGKALAIDIVPYLDVCVGSIINALLFGYRFEGEKLPDFHNLKRMLDDHMRLIADPRMALLTFFPQLQHIPPFRGIFHQAFNINLKSLWAFFDVQIEEHNQHFDPNAEPTDFVQAFLKEMHQTKADDAKQGNYCMLQLKNVCFDLWIAGMETTITTLRWGALHMIHNPDIQAKIQAEIDEHITDDREIQMSDKNALPYTMAAVNEMQRTANILAQNLFHKTTRDTTIRGYKIEKGTVCLPQISAVHLDPKLFPNPERFDPTRYLNADGSPKKVDALIPFSVGKRQCLGESLARMELFLVFANLLRKFKLSATPGEKLPSLEPRMGITVQPHAFKCCIEVRR